MNTNGQYRSVAQTIGWVILLIIALYSLVGGVWLATLGGSWYYAVLGIVLLVCAGLLWSNRETGLWLYALVLAATVVWGVWEAGTDFWALAPRYDILFLLGLWLLLPPATRGFAAPRPAKAAIGIAMIAMLGVLGYGIFNDPQEINGTLSRAQPAEAKPVSGVAAEDWPSYGRTEGGVRYSPLTQINDSNAKNLQVAWTYRTGDFRTENDSAETTNEVTPIKVGDKLFLCTPHQFLDALDAATGKRLWRYDPKLKADKTFQHLTCRGVSYHDAGNTERFPASLAKGDSTASTICPRKILLPANDGRLIAVNADNGQKCSDFGNDGEIDLQKSMPHAYPGGYNPTSPPVVTSTTIVIGGSVTDNFSNKEPSGVIRGYDVRTGALKWVFDTGAQDPNAMPGEATQFVHNSPNAWAPLAYDAQSDVVYVPTGVGTPDIWGGDRDPLKERYANSMLALDATTGRLIWHFQTTHHDLWDMDVPAQPSLMDVTLANGQTMPAIYVLTKTGNVFVLDRRNGQPIVPVTEKAVPQNVARGPQTRDERYAPTQPFSALNLAPQEKLTDKDMWGATMLDQLMCRVIFKRLNYDGIYTPPSENGTLVFPGNLGVFEWGGMSVNQDRQVALMNPIGLPFVSKLIPEDANRPHKEKHAGAESGVQPMYGTPYGVELNPFLSPLGLPCKAPAWGYVAGVDLQNHQVVWKKRIGTIRDSLPQLFQLPPLKIGVPGLGGPISTAGNVMFVAATQDNYLRAFNVSNGELLWEGRLPAGGQATPMTYAVNGKQYVVVMAGGHASFGTKMGDYLVAYALPD
ncbi:glucose/quinate/shikimate family membrane-bound PQQ-dependent dehydrogenase [Bordetella genomosp. 4]|uniref:Membrane-bound PQQ-dependent dehydrogenase, glucose/quinate/shikimate family n=1 Tax=Bordetella genomosp. 4 TaxID=463044 RepID=A0A261TMM9_9BORD|nr:glucose/quinate/shikimate family membrane-bound PQQ-dependent dehydrogenase [Bordetella genomosp. 4]OZI50695.1 membrane-bound PQQ-dependent dehydrogenase, glucose/quinate/shikimate family [Bordetella genomosp. 4]